MATPLGKLFGRSPVAPLQHHMQLAEECVQLLCQLVEASCSDGPSASEDIRESLAEAVDGARLLRRDIRENLPRGLLLAMPRVDLLGLLESQQRIADAALAAATPLAVRGLEVPASLRKPLQRLCSLLADCASQAQAAIRELDEMLEKGFGGDQKIVRRALDTLDRQRQRCREQHLRVLRGAQAAEASLAPLDAMFLYRLSDALAELAELSGEVGEQMRLLLAH
jgi:predicted phosphate transport protein (TIGR00153 family)